MARPKLEKTVSVCELGRSKSDRQWCHHKKLRNRQFLGILMDSLFKYFACYSSYCMMKPLTPATSTTICPVGPLILCNNRQAMGPPLCATHTLFPHASPTLLVLLPNDKNVTASYSMDRRLSRFNNLFHFLLPLPQRGLLFSCSLP